MTLESAPDITPVEHDKDGDHSAPATAPGDAEATALVDGVKTVDSPASRKSEGDLAERPVRDFKDLGTGSDPRPVIPLKDVGTSRDPRPQHPLKDHLTDEHSGPVRPFGETADKAELPAKPLGARAMAAATDLVRPKAAPVERATHSGFEPEMSSTSHRGGADAHPADEEHPEERAAGSDEHGADQRHDRDEEADEGGESSGGDHPEDDALLLASFLLPFAMMAAEDAAEGDGEPRQGDDTRPETGGDDEDPESPDGGDDDETPPDEDGGDRNSTDRDEPRGEEPDGGGEGGKDKDPPGGRGGDGNGDGNGPKDGEPGDEEEPEDDDTDGKDERDEDAAREANTDTDTDAAGDDELPRVPRQRELEERALDRLGEDRADDEAAEAEGDEGAVEDEEERARVHAASLDELRDLADRAKIIAPPGGGHSKLRVEEGGKDVGHELADMYQRLREGSPDMPPVTNWREEITSPEHLRDGQIIHVASMRELDELMERVGGWVNQDTRAERRSDGYGGDFKPGQWVNPNQKPSQQLSRIRDFKGRPFHGRMTNIEAMAVPANMQGTTGNARYFAVSAQLQTTGRAPEPERPTWVVGVRSGDYNQGPNAIQGRSGNIGRVPASAVAWRVQARARHIGTDVERNNRMHAIRSGIETKRR